MNVTATGSSGNAPDPVDVLLTQLQTESEEQDNQTHGSVSAAKKTGKNRNRTQVRYLCAP